LTFVAEPSPQPNGSRHKAATIGVRTAHRIVAWREDPTQIGGQRAGLCG
jgi:hypothetical protein